MSAPVDDIEESRSLEDRNTKKVRFKEESRELVSDIAIDLDQTQAPSLIPSWKEKLLGVGSSNPGKISGGSTGESEGNFELLEDDVRRYFVNDISSIDFSNRIKQILIKDKEKTVVLKLLGYSIG
ncbi:hypothetical protein PVK06_040965 [Gossypium arboreum]|uniref:Uncharacterized protein n=1 Tax=Gossypium arboreum TaxID=29729 RepID=A0ABR0N9R6_GOSAR|nr:hypothetical protein PVK06_040965 [Gossypium arboreum]